MVHNCANPACSAVLHRLGDGRLFAFDPRLLAGRAAGSRSASTSPGRRYHWLCNACCKTLTVSLSGGVIAVVAKEPISPPSLRPRSMGDRETAVLDRTASNF